MAWTTAAPRKPNHAFDHVSSTTVSLARNLFPEARPASGTPTSTAVASTAPSASNTPAIAGRWRRSSSSAVFFSQPSLGGARIALAAHPGASRKGFFHRRPSKCAKSLSQDTSVASRAMAHAARCASVLRFPAVPV